MNATEVKRDHKYPSNEKQGRRILTAFIFRGCNKWRGVRSLFLVSVIVEISSS